MFSINKCENSLLNSEMEVPGCLYIIPTKMFLLSLLFFPTDIT